MKQLFIFFHAKIISSINFEDISNLTHIDINTDQKKRYSKYVNNFEDYALKMFAILQD